MALQIHRQDTTVLLYRPYKTWRITHLGVVIWHLKRVQHRGTLPLPWKGTHAYWVAAQHSDIQEKIIQRKSHLGSANKKGPCSDSYHLIFPHWLRTFQPKHLFSIPEGGRCCYCHWHNPLLRVDTVNSMARLYSTRTHSTAASAPVWTHWVSASLCLCLVVAVRGKLITNWHQELI